MIMPEDIQKVWKKIIPALGLKVTRKAERLFSKEKMTIDSAERDAFAEAYPEDADWFEEIAE